MNTKIGVYYGSVMGNTSSAAEQIADLLGDGATAIDVSGNRNFEDYDILILGTSTWGLGELQDDWLGAVDTLSGANLAGKKFAVFGMGDQESYSDTFVDGMRDLYDAAIEAGAEPVGAWNDDDYDFSESRAVEGEGMIGLALDDDNQSELTSSRIESWVEKLKDELGL